MSRAMIYISLNDSDINKKLYPDLRMLPEQKHILPYIMDKLECVTLSKKYMGIYHHRDSNPEWLGKELVKNYNTYEKVLNLMLFGDELCVVNGIEPYYYSRNDENETWERNKPLFYDNLDTAMELIGNYSYFYLFENNKWQVCPNMQWKHDWKGFKDLNEII